MFLIIETLQFGKRGGATNIVVLIGVDFGEALAVGEDPILLLDDGVDFEDEPQSLIGQHPVSSFLVLVDAEAAHGLVELLELQADFLFGFRVHLAPAVEGVVQDYIPQRKYFAC